MVRTLAALTVLLAVAACDSASSSDDLVGVWAVMSETSEYVGVVSQGQTIADLVDPDGSIPPSAGSFTVSGGESGSFSTAYRFSRNELVTQLYVASFDVNRPERPPVRYYLSLLEFAWGQAASLTVETDAESRSYRAESDDLTLFTRDGFRYTVNANLAATSGSEKTVLVEGALALRTRSVPAGRPVVLSEFVDTFVSFPPGSARRYVFEPDGEFATQFVQGDTLIERVGTWERSGDQVRMPTQLLSVDSTRYLYRVDTEGGTLVLANDGTLYPCDASCRRLQEANFSLKHGTLDSFHTRIVLRLRPSPTGRYPFGTRRRRTGGVARS